MAGRYDFVSLTHLLSSPASDMCQGAVWSFHPLSSQYRRVHKWGAHHSLLCQGSHTIASPGCTTLVLRWELKKCIPM